MKTFLADMRSLSIFGPRTEGSSPTSCVEPHAVLRTAPGNLGGGQSAKPGFRQGSEAHET